MKKIPLGNGTHAIVDDEDYGELSRYRWRSSSARIPYPIRNHWDGEKIKAVFMHRQVMNFPDELIDHVNRNPRDNRKSNLRLCSNQQNLMNRGPNANNKSGYKGVYWCKSRKKWIAQLRHNGKIITKSFENKEDAARHYDLLAYERHGEFAHLNFGEPVKAS